MASSKIDKTIHFCFLESKPEQRFKNRRVMKGFIEAYLLTEAGIEAGAMASGTKYWKCKDLN